MSLNPIIYTEKVVADFLKYQLTAYAFADERLREQMRQLLSLEVTRETPLLKGPYVSLSRAFRTGAAVRALVQEGVFHPHMENLIPHPHLYGHQEKAIRAIRQGKTTLVSTGTGSGKTECFLYPVISRCLQLRDKKAAAGIVAVFVYPMNALAEDQLMRIRSLLAGTGVTFGMYVGKTPEGPGQVNGERLGPNSSRADYEAALEKARAEKRNTAVHPPEERCSRDEMREGGGQPRILLTNVKQLELLLTRHKDVELFDQASLEFLVFDEAHTFAGAAGAETACLIRRLRSFCGRSAAETVCIGTSATLIDAQLGPDAGLEFASRFFGVPTTQVTAITEEYQKDDWTDGRRVCAAPPASPTEHLREVLAAVEADSPAPLCNAYEHLSRRSLPNASMADWAAAQETLYGELAANDLCFQLAEVLSRPRPLRTLASELSDNLRRAVTEEEILCWLALGAASRREERPLLRPVVHGFVSGVSGGVVSFPPQRDGPQLWLSAETQQQEQLDDRLFTLPITTCSTCGQHYFVHWVRDLKVTPDGLGGGEATVSGRFWQPLDEAQDGCRVVLLDRLIADDDDDAEPSRTQAVFLCRSCGALHPEEVKRCDGCGRPGPPVRLFAVEFSDDNPGYLISCLSCRAPGRPYGSGYREPARPVRAVTVADIHVLAQNMIHNADRRRLLVFADNRQDAAFQAGWMRDHARRFRLRALMAQRLEEGPVSVDDLVHYLDELLNGDDDLSQALIPEVWEAQRKAVAGVQHARERKTFLRIQVLREIATGVKQRVGLEPWGRMRVEYLGLQAELPFIRKWASTLKVEPQRLADGIAAILDQQRRNLHVLDRDGGIFSRFWREGDREIQLGYMPLLRGIPKGLKLRRQPTDSSARVTQWSSVKGRTGVEKAAAAFGVPKAVADEFIEGLWRLLTEEIELLAPVTLRSNSGKAISGCTGVRQIDADRLVLHSHRGRWRCRKCQRAQIRPTPQDRCLAFNCDGTLQFETEDPENYDLVALDQGFAMLRPAEHSAQVPADERERLELLFKGDSELINTLVCTPTLELGVDIGALDTILMRNVPPLPANYWQRAGRAGRRHRLAVNLVYARPTSHDRAYFAEPLKLLEGAVTPPRFNMKNEVMVGKHVRAAVVTRLRQLARLGGRLAEAERAEVAATLDQVLPTFVRSYLFDDNGNRRTTPLDVSALDRIIHKHLDDLVAHVDAVFRQNWPEADSEVVKMDRLRALVLTTAQALEEVIRTLKKRLDWCMTQLSRLVREVDLKGSLSPEDKALRRRCERLVSRLKGEERSSWGKGDTYDKTYTYGALAVEGFFPGYGLESGAIVATAVIPSGDDFDLGRSPAVALREYVPGNLLYANGRRFTPRHFHLEPTETLLFQVDVAHEAVHELGVDQPGFGAGLGAGVLKAVPMCDVDLAHLSQISDEEEFRFQAPVAVYGHERDRHGGGKMFRWGERALAFRRGVHLRLVNVGTALLIKKRLGYPVSLVNGQSRSPFASQTELGHFAENHLKNTGKTVESVGFYADTEADTLGLQDCPDRMEAYSVLEALRIGMSQILEMEREDLQILVVGHPGKDEVDALLYDPMAGGSGLIEQACERWDEVVSTAIELLEACASACEDSCIDCMRTFRNAFFHRYLDRHLAIEKIKEWGTSLHFSHEITPKLPAGKPKDDHQPVNLAEQKLRGMLERAGFPEGQWQYAVELGKALGRTIPDVFFESDDEDEPGICVYLDGLSEHYHGNTATKARDLQIRETLRARGYEVFAIAATELDDRDAMAKHFYRLAKALLGKDRAKDIKQHADWYGDPGKGGGGDA